MASFKSLNLLLLLASVTLVYGFQYEGDDKIVPYSTIRMRRRLHAKRRHRNICNPENDERNNEKLKEIIGRSDFAFTGKVVSYYVEVETNSVRDFHKRDSERREKRRRLKKTKSTSRNKTRTSTSTPNPSNEMNSIDVNLDLREGKGETFIVELKRVIKGGEDISGKDKVVVKVPKEFASGLEITSDPTLNTNCIEFHPVLKLRQTAILLARKVNGSEILELSYFPVAMTLRHLDWVDAAVTGTVKVK